MSNSSFQIFLKWLSPKDRQCFNDALEKVKAARKNYKEIVNDCYKKQDAKKLLFPPMRECYEENFVADLMQYDELVAHCLRAGDTDLLKTWGIDPIFSQPSGLHRLALRDDMECYVNSFNDCIQNSQTDLEETCWIILRDKFLNPGLRHGNGFARV
jgi:hypothetical protein